MSSDSNHYINTSDDNEPKRSPKPGSSYSDPTEDQSGIDGDDNSEEEHHEVVFIGQDQVLWTIKELEVLCPFKDEWAESTTN